jgi:serine/threonine protein kinase
MVAVKVLALNQETASHIQHEIDLMKRCMHPNIVAYRDAFHRSMHGAPTLWVVMEMAEFGSTLDVMRKRAAPLPEAAIGWVCAGVLAGLHYMHTIARAIHRDIKAANVLVMRDAVVKLADLGVAAQLQRTMSRRGTMIGTPHWMAPEAFTGQNADGEETEYDCRVDVWSLGVTAIELAEKQPPHAQKRSIFQVMVHIANAPPPELAPTTDASPAFRAFVAAALIKQPTDRPTAAELGKHHFVVGATSDALAAVVAELPTATPTRGKEPMEGTLPAQLQLC